ncbi:ABC transporter substrate-binding protein [Streptomyces sp. 8L]|uniref:ABC transporter substrate-binding protein n=1 Tax=Streptomyces sp. 8L TaxID=2877242 RepID=UPI001CD73628|nr:ABC transporter substrate-binding protein [Streptomyces sp. 8L]MCA1223482.1 ABC transporter substrate-binding protein [Streptomyces sp. 8L]
MRAPRPRTARPSFRPRAVVLAGVAALMLPALAACGDGPAGSGGGPAGAGAASPAPTADVLAAVAKKPGLTKLLPAAVRARGTLRIASSVGAPPSAYFPNASTKKPAGLDIDIADAAAKVLGVRLERQEASFDAILPALGSGKYDIGTGNFGVTDERRKTIDFVTYINDGQGFAVAKDNTGFKRITSLVQLCGKNIGVGAGTTFEATLNSQKAQCARAGKKPYQVKVYSDNGAALTSLQQGRIDITMSTINGLRYEASQPAAGVKFLNEFQRLDVGFALKKGSPLAKPLQAAVNELIADGTYAKILAKWGVRDSAITTSRISPPELKPQHPAAAE